MTKWTDEFAKSMRHYFHGCPYRDYVVYVYKNGEKIKNHGGLYHIYTYHIENYLDCYINKKGGRYIIKDDTNRIWKIFFKDTNTIYEICKPRHARAKGF